MRVYRLYRKRRRATTYTGEGARLTGARWNLPGAPMVYSAAHVSLCVLEFLVHFDPRAVDPDLLDLEYRAAHIPVDLPVWEVPINQLPKDWNTVPAPLSTQEAGSRWASEMRYAVILVPSVIVPAERIVLLNPLHPDYARITLDTPVSFELDTRIFRARPGQGA